VAGDDVVECNATWGTWMCRRKAAAEGMAPGPLLFPGRLAEGDVETCRRLAGACRGNDRKGRHHGRMRNGAAEGRMSTAGLPQARLDRMHGLVACYVDGVVPGLVALVRRCRAVQLDATGILATRASHRFTPDVGEQQIVLLITTDVPLLPQHPN
jgi:hypothetical protein